MVGQKVNPTGFRLGIYIPWAARWFARASYGKSVLEDVFIRSYLDKALNTAEVSRIEIEKAGDSLKIIIFSARPGMVIGKKGQEIDFLRKDLARLLNRKNIEISVQEVKNPELDANLVARQIVEQIERRVNHKQAMKRAAASTMRSRALGVKICVAGRIGGAEIARTEWLRIGQLPLHTLRADIDYGFCEAKTTYGIIGVKVWICRGEFH